MVVTLAVSADTALIGGNYGFALRLNVLAYTLFSSLAIKEGWYPDIGHWAHLGGILFGAAYYFLALDGVAPKFGF